jgi:RimJ/RimL family protein N-acetyltransferase
VVLAGERVRLEPMRMEHLEDLAAVAFEPAIWRWMPMQMETTEQLQLWMQQAMDQAAKGRALPWVTRSLVDGDGSSGKVVGSTRFMDIETQHRTLEIGGTWLAPDWQRSGINVEAKFLQLRYAFEELGAIRVALKTHHENLRSQSAIEALGAAREGVFRNHMIMPDNSYRHTVWYSITAEEWPGVKSRLQERLFKYA